MDSCFRRNERMLGQLHERAGNHLPTRSSPRKRGSRRNASHLQHHPCHPGNEKRYPGPTHQHRDSTPTESRLSGRDDNQDALHARWIPACAGMNGQSQNTRSSPRKRGSSCNASHLQHRPCHPGNEKRYPGPTPPHRDSAPNGSRLSSPCRVTPATRRRSQSGRGSRSDASAYRQAALSPRA
jgi:hypothetical protein